MLYAKVAVGLPVEGPFDYIVPKELRNKIRPGTRVWVMFGQRKIIGYVVKLSKKTNISKIKPILELIDNVALLDDKMLRLTKELSDYYCCSWGEAIETTLPQALRKGKRITAIDTSKNNKEGKDKTRILVCAPGLKSRWEIYLEYIKKAINNKNSVIILLPDMHSLKEAKEIIHQRLDVMPHLLYRRQANDIKEWTAIREQDSGIAMGIRSAIFAPVKNLRLIIIDEEHNFVYKQDQVPHYHAREVAFMRADIDRADLVLGSSSASMEMLYLARKNKINYIAAETKFNFPEVRIVDMRNSFGSRKKTKIIFSKFLQDAIYSVLNSKGKVLLFLNRKGFATSASCFNCGFALKCPRCNINLIYHYKDETLSCHYCNFKMPPPKICPNCNAGYIKYSGIGTEKIESELSALFPATIIKRIETNQELNLKDADIFVATSAIMKQADTAFALIGVLSIDNSLNQLDLRSSEKAFAILVSLSGLAEKKMIIQTAVPGHHCFQALVKKDLNLFYDEELKQRRQLHFPPYRNLILVKLRGRSQTRVKLAAETLFERLVKAKKSKGTRILSLNPGTHPKLRDNFYQQILISCDNVQRANKFLKFNLKGFSRSGIIVTVDVDPI